MRIQGVDPVIVNRIQEKVKEKIVQEPGQVIISTNQQKHHDQNQSDQQSGEDLETVIKKLNQAGIDIDLDLQFVLDKENENIVLVLEKASGRVIHQLTSAKARALLAELKNKIGVMIDYYL